MEIPKATCDTLRSSNPRIRHTGYYDGFGRILCDSVRPDTKPMEGVEEMHILNGTVASMLNLWNPASPLIGKVTGFIMMRERLTALIYPHEEGRYFLTIFEAGTGFSEIETAQSLLVKELESLSHLQSE